MKRRTILTTVLVLAATLLVLAPAVQARELSGDCGCECRSPGYWKNHPEAWPVEEITIAGTTYTRDEAIEYMNTPVRGDKTYTMFKALVAAELNVMKGCNDCIECVIEDAQSWMAANPLGSNVRGNSEAWKCDGERLYEKLDWYNNNCTCCW